uniref:ABC transmembrane type-1 domain-containing protein n=1 Tax=Aegilops tauschii subsp. strangulata TaxID=200361 RepID=A0A453RY59_AEGTS
MCAQTISHIKTVFSFVGENSAMKSFIECMDKQYKLGKKEAITKGLGLGMLQIATFCSYSLTIYIGALAVTRRSCDVTPADIFICNFRYLSNAAPDLQTFSQAKAAALSLPPSSVSPPYLFGTAQSGAVAGVRKCGGGTSEGMRT